MERGLMRRRQFISGLFALAVAPVVSKFVPAPIPRNDYFKSTVDVESVALTPKILRDARYRAYGGARGGGKSWTKAMIQRSAIDLRDSKQKEILNELFA